MSVVVLWALPWVDLPPGFPALVGLSHFSANHVFFPHSLPSYPPLPVLCPFHSWIVQVSLIPQSSHPRLVQTFLNSHFNTKAVHRNLSPHHLES